MKNLILLSLLLLTLSSVAQIDTAYLPPFAYITYDTQEWEISNSENNRYSTLRLKGKKEKGFELKIRLNLGDTLITKENLLAKFEARTPYGREMVVESFTEMGEYFLGVFSFSQDECSRNDIPAMFKSMKFRAAFRIINNTNLLSVEIDDDTFFFPEETQTQQLQNVVNSIRVITPSQLDQMLGYPISKQQAEELVKQTYQKKYKEYFDFNLAKRKCFDDSYFLNELITYFEYSEIDSLINFASDSTLSDLVAMHLAAIDSTEKAEEIKNKVEIGFNYTERTELYSKAQKEAFTLFEYLDFQLGEAQEGPIQRLIVYSNQSGEYNNQSKYGEIIARMFEKQYLPSYSLIDIDFESIGNHRYLARVFCTNQDTINESLFYHLEKSKDSYLINRINIPEGFNNVKMFGNLPADVNINLAEIDFPIWEFVTTISSSPKDQFLALYTNSDDKTPKYISLGTSKEVNWIALEPLILDSSKYILIQDFSNDYEYHLETDMFWNEFKDSSEKKRLSEKFSGNYAMSLDSTIANMYTPTNRKQDEQINPWDLKNFIAHNARVEYIANIYTAIADINSDGNEDVYSILFSNGKVIEAKAYLLSENTYKVIGTKEVVKLLKDNSGFKNLMLRSQIGNHGNDFIQSENDLYKISTH